MSTGPKTEYILFGDSAAARCIPGGTQYNSRYLTGLGEKPDLSDGLDFVDNPANYHGIRIKSADACVLASRILMYRIAHGVMSEQDAKTIPCVDCPHVSTVLEDRRESTE